MQKMETFICRLSFGKILHYPAVGIGPTGSKLGTPHSVLLTIHCQRV